MFGSFQASCVALKSKQKNRLVKMFPSLSSRRQNFKRHSPLFNKNIHSKTPSAIILDKNLPMKFTKLKILLDGKKKLSLLREIDKAYKKLTPQRTSENMIKFRSSYDSPIPKQHYRLKSNNIRYSNLDKKLEAKA